MPSAGESSAQDVSPPETLESFAGLVKKFAPASYFLERHDDRALDMLQVVGKTFMRQQAQAAMNSAGKRSVLMVYGSDLTPMLLRFRTAVKINDRYELREGGRPCEWMVHRAYFLWVGDDAKLNVRTLFEAPVLMQSKKTWHLYACAERLTRQAVPVCSDVR